LKVAISNHERWDELRIRINRNPCPNITESKLTFLIGGDVLLFGVAEAPALIALNPLALESAKRAVLVIGSCIPDLGKQA